MAMMYDMGYTDRQISVCLGCNRSTVTFQRKKTKFEMTGDLKDPEVCGFWHEIKKELAGTRTVAYTNLYEDKSCRQKCRGLYDSYGSAVADRPPGFLRTIEIEY